MYRYDLFLHLSRPNPTMISLIDKEKINDAKKMLHRGLRTTKNKYPKLYCLFSYQNHLYFDKINFKKFLKKTAIPFFKNENNNKQLSIFYIDLATCYQKENQFEKACLYYQKGISCIRIVKSLNLISSHLIKIFSYNFNKKTYSKLLFFT